MAQTSISHYLDAVISSQTVKHESAATSGKQEATIANKDQLNSFAFKRSAFPG